MKNPSIIYNDPQARQRALSPHHSFIIQAPAGSGKTELLIQRFLVLLTTVDQCDKVLAITFTKKAAGEMRCRIYHALERAKIQDEPEKAHEKLTWNLARNVFEHAMHRGWDLSQIASQLSIMTIDACCQKLLGLCQPPYQLHSQLALCLYPKPFYQQSVRQFIQSHCIHHNARFCKAFNTLLRHQHHDIRRVEQLLVSALMNREKWLRITLETNQIDFQQVFMHAIACAQEAHIKQCLNACPNSDMRALIHALKQLHGINQSIGLSTALENLIADDYRDWEIQQWQQFAKWILTQKGTCRGRMTSQQGFAAKSNLKSLDRGQQAYYQATKSTAMQHIAEIGHAKSFIGLLHDTNRLPEVEDPDTEWQYLQPMLELLPSLAAFFQLQMHEEKMTDFAGINLQLLSALLDEGQQQALIYQVYQQFQHCLIDEFQDTSVSQFEILEMALSSWKDENSRSITVVGDPMQSIYRFRQAEVTLFRQVQKNGFSGKHLENLHLNRNYRSSEILVKQLNQCFERFMTPEHNQFFPAEAVFQREESGLFWHQAPDQAAQNNDLCTLIQSLNQRLPNASKCLLVRSRNQLAKLLPLFNQHNIAYSGVGIHALSQCQAVLDCFHLSCLGYNLHDRKHWLACLLSPAVALPLQDIEHLCNDKHMAIWQAMNEKKNMLSAEGQRIIERIQPAIQHFLQHVGRSKHVENTKRLWRTLGFPWIIQTEAEKTQCHQFFDLMQDLEESGQAVNATTLQQLLDTYPENNTQSQENDLQIMTIHKSKGLEFDIVIMPHLEQSTPIAEKTLLDWVHVPDEKHWHLLMHAHPRHQQQASSVHHFLRYKDKQAQLAETERLYYVAFTRAKQQLHILNSEVEHYAERSPMRNLAPLLSTLEPPCTENTSKGLSTNEQPSAVAAQRSRYTLPANWKNPEISTNKNDCADKETHKSPDFNLQDILTNSLSVPSISDTQWGDCIHRYLEYYLQQPKLETTLSYEKFEQIASGFGIQAEHHQASMEVIYQQLNQQHRQYRFQWIYRMMQGQLIEQPIRLQNTQLRVDCMRIDQEKQEIWIIDFKTHGVSKLLTQNMMASPTIIPEHYWFQLNRYAQAMHELYPKYRIHIALYYPLVDYWLERQYQEEKVIAKN